MKQVPETKTTRFGIFPKLLIVLVVVALVPLLVVWYLNYQTMMTQMTLTAHERIASVASALANRVDDWMDMNSRMLRENAAESGIRSMDPEQQRPDLKLIKTEYPWIHAVLVMAPDGRSISRSDDESLKDYSDRAYVQQVLAGQAMGQQVLIGKTTGLPGLALAVPIHDGAGGIKGILTISMATAVISAYVTNLRIGETGHAFLLDKEGKVIAHQSMEDSTFRKDFSEHPAYLAFTAEGKESLVYRDERTDRDVIAYMRSTGGGWTLVIQQDYDEAFSAIAATNRNATITLAISLSAVLLIAFLLSRRLTHPIRRLTSVANEASLANFSAINRELAEKDRGDEIGELARSVERLAVSLRAAIGRLQKKP